MTAINFRVFYFLIGFMLLAGTVIAGTSDTYAITASNPTDKAILNNISSLRHSNALSSVNKTVNSKNGNFSLQNERAVQTIKSKPKTNKIVYSIIVVVLVTLIIFSVNSARYYSTRICSYCSFNGKMTPITLSKNKIYNKFLLISVMIIPEILYFYSKEGRFKCPKCHRTHTHISIKSNPNEVDISMKGLITKRTRHRHKQRKA